MALTSEPGSFAKNERVDWTKYLADYPPSLWTLQYRFRGPSTGFNIAATTDTNPSRFAATISATQTGTMTAGAWWWEAWVTEIADSTNKKRADEGTVNVEAGFASGTTTAVDNRTENEIILAAIKTTIQTSASKTQSKYEISTPAGSTRIEYKSWTDLLAGLKYYQQLVNAERRGGGIGKTYYGVMYDD